MPSPVGQDVFFGRVIPEKRTRRGLRRRSDLLNGRGVKPLIAEQRSACSRIAARVLAFIRCRSPGGPPLP
jgi:hypothetical protein